MPRQARIDVPGLAYHVMSRGIERREIFVDDEDRAAFMERISACLKRSGAKCLAWCLMPNHFHMLVLRGGGPLSEMMHRAMTGYARNFNARHDRVGHVFQNRYKSIVCSLESYLLEVVPYIHLNPLRAGLVEGLGGLESYAWCGHAAVVSGRRDGVLDRDELLGHFGGDEAGAVEAYLGALSEKISRDHPGPREADRAAVASGKRAISDPRVLGGADFVEAVLKAAGERERREKISREKILEEVAGLTGLSREEIVKPSRERGPARARAIYCCRCKDEGGIPRAELGQELCVGQSAISKLVAKGRTLLGLCN